MSSIWRLKNTQVLYQYIYMSHRLLADVYKQGQAQASDWRTQRVDAKSPFGGIAVEWKGEQPDNDYWLVHYADRVLEDRTGSLTTTCAGLYVWAQMRLTWSLLPIGDVPPRPIAWMYSRYVDKYAGKTLCVLLGSAPNYRGFGEGSGEIDPNLVRGWHVSSVGGLTAIATELAQGFDNRLQEHFHTNDPQLEEIIWMADHLTPRDGRHIIGEGTVEFLAEVFVHEQDYRFHGFRGPTHYDTVLIGAPLWVRTATPQSLPLDASITPESGILADSLNQGLASSNDTVSERLPRQPGRLRNLARQLFGRR